MMKKVLISLIVLGLIPLVANAAVVFDTAVSAKSCSSCTSLSYTITATTTPNVVTWVDVLTSSANLAVDVSVGGSTATNIYPAGLNTTSVGKTWGAYLMNSGSGSLTIVVHSTSTTNIFSAAATFAGAQRFDTAASSSNSAGTTSFTDNLTTTMNNDLVLGSLNNGAGSPANGAQTNKATNDANGLGIFYATSSASSSQSITLTATSGGATNWNSIIAAFSSDATSTPAATRSILGVGKTRPNSR